MNKINPFEVKEEGSDQENISVLPPVPPLLERGVQPQQQEVNDYVVVIYI